MAANQLLNRGRLKRQQGCTVSQATTDFWSNCDQWTTLKIKKSWLQVLKRYDNDFLRKKSNDNNLFHTLIIRAQSVWSNFVSSISWLNSPSVQQWSLSPDWQWRLQLSAARPLCLSLGNVVLRIHHTQQQHHNNDDTAFNTFTGCLVLSVWNKWITYKQKKQKREHYRKDKTLFHCATVVTCTTSQCTSSAFTCTMRY